MFVCRHLKHALAKKQKACYCLTLVICLVFCCMYWRSYISGVHVLKKPLGLHYVVVHLDLKGAPPNLSYLTSILPILRTHGANALLIEYEDMFPFTGRLASLNAINAYSRSQLSYFLKEAVELGFDIIPLVQTFGHMQYILEQKQYADLRESDKSNDSICPSQETSKALIKDLLDQVITFHTNIIRLKFIHVGCDEVFVMNKCPFCKKRNLSNAMIFHQHVRLVNDIVQNSSPGTDVLIWDDMLRDKDEKLLEPMPVDLVCWHYHTKFPSFEDLRKYNNNFKNVWAASAFKGADGSTSVLPNLVNRIRNHFSWMQFLVHYKGRLGEIKSDFRGIILTGWSRGNHNAPVYDLLPASFHSLIINLILIQKFNTENINDASLMTWNKFYNEKLKKDTLKSLGCFKETNEIEDIHGDNCLFEGSYLNSALKTLESFKSICQAVIDANIYEISDITFTEFRKKKELLNGNTNIIKTMLHDIEQNITDAMYNYFSETVVVDYLIELFHPIRAMLNEIMQY